MKYLDIISSRYILRKGITGPTVLLISRHVNICFQVAFQRENQFYSSTTLHLSKFFLFFFKFFSEAKNSFLILS